MLFRSLSGSVNHARHAAARSRARVRLCVEALEGRTLLSTFVVDRLSDTGTGTGLTGDLRYCITQANSLPGDDTITFAVTGSIQLTGVFPSLSSNINLQGPGADVLTVRRNTGGYYRIFTVGGGTTVVLSGLTITNGSDGVGGGIFNRGTLTLNNSIVSRNQASLGGGIHNVGTLTLNNSTVSGNFVGGVDVYGGGISNYGMLTLNNSTVSGNVAAGYDYSTSFGGGISNDGGTATLNNSTVSGNRGDYGDGIYNQGSITVNSSTFSGNSIFNDGGTLSTRNTIIDGVYGNLGSLGYNLIGNTQGGSGFHPTDLLNVNPLLGPLQDNGGPTFTHALLPGSPALDAGDNTDAPEFDQRGLPRIVADTIDIGAFEVQPGPATSFWLDAPAAVAAGIPFDLTLYALDDYGHLATGYEGTVTFSTTDKAPGVLLPADYTFTADDQGIHTFPGETALVTPGEQYLGALDTDGKAFGAAVLMVVPGGAPGRHSGRPGTVPDWVLAADLLHALTWRADRADGFWVALAEESRRPDPA